MLLRLRMMEINVKIIFSIIMLTMLEDNIFEGNRLSIRGGSLSLKLTIVNLVDILGETDGCRKLTFNLF